VIPVVRLDGRVIGTGAPGEVTGRILAVFRQRVLTEGTRI
jgi:branched-chain amino acid aminotransferase